MSRRWSKAIIAIFALLVVLGTLAYVEYQRIVLSAEAYLFGYPLVIMDVTRKHSAQSIGPENQLRRVRKFPDAKFKDVVRPNVDTLYTMAFIDMAKGPWVFEMAPNSERYELMPLMDGWTNVFASPGTRTTGTQGGRFLLVGPHWTGTAADVPDGLVLLRSPTDMTWLIGRTQTNGASDYPQVHHLQDALSLKTLSQYLHQAPDTQATWTPSPDTLTPPIEQMKNMRTEVFFTRLAELMVNNPPAAQDRPMVEQLLRLGVAPGRPPHWGMLDQWTFDFGRQMAEKSIRKAMSQSRESVRGWSTPPSILGNYGTAYNVRAAVAMAGLGANLPQDAVYPSALVDEQGRAFDGSAKYRLHFDKAQLPPVNAFWSVTAYGVDNFLIDNPLNRYALGDRDPLTYNPDGSLDLWIQANPPDDKNVANWLPVKPGQPFVMTARLYWPKAQALNNSWGMPAVQRITPSP